MDTNYLFSLKMDQTEFTVGGDKEFVESYINKWIVLFKDKLPSELLGKPQEEEQKPQAPVSRGKTSLPDFIKIKAPKNWADLILVIFFYYERYEGLENVGVGFRQVMDFIFKMPNHPSEEELGGFLQQLIEQLFIEMMPGTENNPKYQVTFPGEQCVKQGFTE